MHTHNTTHSSFACAGKNRPEQSPSTVLAAVLDLPTFIVDWDQHNGGIWVSVNEAHMVLIWHKSCPCLCDDNHGVVADIQQCGSGKV